MSDPKPGKPATTSFQPPRGTRDFYPIEMARRLWLEDKWRRTAVRHGFDEIDGPTFEHLDLYTVKSGDGIVSELFSFSRAGGETPFALRPEFTPTLARMVATKANALPKPIKWFSIGPYFRAERPQRGRLREFLQWNVDSLGDPSPEADAEVIACCVESLRSLGMTSRQSYVAFSSRAWLSEILRTYGISSDQESAVLALVDRGQKIGMQAFESEATALGLHPELIAYLSPPDGKTSTSVLEHLDIVGERMSSADLARRVVERVPSEDYFGGLRRSLGDLCDGDDPWCVHSPWIVRGLAYYTGLVFEVQEYSLAERAIAGGGRYDNLVELFGGSPTPAVGFAMGDVVISLVLQDKGLMPSDDDIARDLALAPDAFILAANDDADAKALRPLLAALRRLGLHARRSYKSTRNVGKLLQDADKSRARYAVILESDTRAQLKDLSSKEQHEVVADDLASLAAALAERITPPR